MIMSDKKGFILVAVPERCSMCRYMYRTGENYCFCKVEGYGFDYQVNEYMRSKAKGKPDWCPIKEFPDKKPLYAENGDRPLDWEFNVGWNGCVDYLEGE